MQYLRSCLFAGRSDEVLSAKSALDAELRANVAAKLNLHAGEGQGLDTLLNRLVRLKGTDAA